MNYHLRLTKRFIKDLEKIDKSQQKILIYKIYNDLENTLNPREKGKALKGYKNNYWRYRYGDYRIIVEIIDLELLIIGLEIGHRNNIYIKVNIK